MDKLTFRHKGLIMGSCTIKETNDPLSILNKSNAYTEPTSTIEVNYTPNERNVLVGDVITDGNAKMTVTHVGKGILKGELF